MSDNLNNFEIFCAVAETGSISKAAKTHYLSQPAISQAVKNLESDYNTKLFVRHPKGVNLSPAGEKLYARLAPAFKAIDDARDELKNSAGGSVSHLSIGVSTTLCKHALLPHLQEYMKQNPNVQIKINCQATNETLKMLNENELDLGLIAKPKNIKGLHFAPLMKVKDTFVASPEYLETLAKTASSRAEIVSNKETSEQTEKNNNHKLDYLNDANIMMLDKTNLTRSYLDEYLESKGIRFKNIIEVTTMDLITEFAKCGLGIGCVIKGFVKDELKSGELVEVKDILPTIKMREIGFACKQYSLKNEDVARFIEM